MTDTPILDKSVHAAPKQYVVAGAQEIILKGVTASFDGTGAGGSFVPSIQIIDPGGNVIGTYTLGQTLTAGASADVSWFPGVTNVQTPTPTTVRDFAAYFGDKSCPTGTTSTLLDWSSLRSDPDGLIGFTAGVAHVNFDGVYEIWVVTNTQAGVFDSTKEMSLTLTASSASVPVVGIAAEQINNYTMAASAVSTNSVIQSQTVTASLLAGDEFGQSCAHNYGSTITIHSQMFIGRFA